MRTRFRRRAPAPILLAAGVLLALLGTACDGTPADSHGGGDGADVPDQAAISDRPIGDCQVRLLDLAFGAASAMPLDPHVKDRSRAQEEVVTACLELDQPQRALGFIDRIANWRRGAAYADLARYCVQELGISDVQRFLDLATAAADESARDRNPQAWRRDRVRAKIAGVLLLLGEVEKSEQFAAGIADSEQGHIQVASVLVSEPASFDAQLAAFDAMLATGSFDQVRGVMMALAGLYDRFHADQQKRLQIEARVTAASHNLPVQVRLEMIMELVQSALAHDDPARARDLLKKGRAVAGEFTWLPENRIQFLAQLAELRFRAGEEEGARSEADTALALYTSERERIVDIQRADALRPLAAAYHAMGVGNQALKVYGMAVREGSVNPNSRPRAEDLAATCCSMAIAGFEPDEPLWAEIQEIYDGLGRPW